MTVSMISCPECRTLLFSDTVICPACQHILDAERAAQLGVVDDLGKSRSEQVPCRACGEANQIGLVRCWNCSTFLREDIQEAYYEMLRSQREVIYSQPGSFRQAPQPEPPSHAGEESFDDASNDDDDDDFELSDAYSLTSPEAPADQPSGTYKLEGSRKEASDGYGLSQTPPAAGAPETQTSQNSPTAKQAGPGESDSTKEEGDAETPNRSRPADDEGAEDHSVATGGDVLLDIALKEEAEAEKNRKRQGKRRQQKGKPSGEAPSPERRAAQKKALARRKAAQKRAAERKEPTENFGLWLNDVRMHKINLQKLKLKPGSEEKQFEPVDVGCSSTGVILVSLAGKPGFTLFSKPKTNPEETRKAVRAHLEAEKDIKDLPAPSHEFLEGEAIGQIKVVQPVVYVHESMFAGVPVFGEGRIAVRLPAKADAAEQRFLSFWLTEFRRFSQALEKLGVKDFGHLEGVPLTDPILDLTCHYSEVSLKPVDPEAVKFFEADPSYKTELIGRRCEGCGLAVSEDARRKEKIGGLNGKAIAKAKCPKCEEKFGDISLFKITVADKKAGEPKGAGSK